ncbi:MAG: DinB superfamily protein [Flammeovirgaceae bacterium]|nr:DinB superfamily protein [Flammeovirgaceae bacterium]
MNTELAELFTRDLNRLIKELEQYPNEEQLWVVTEGINNSAGTLTLHLIGNLNHFFGAILGNTGYIRNREAEFSDRNIPVSEMISSIHKTSEVINNVLLTVNSETLTSDYPLQVFGEPIKTSKFLIHLQGHLNYHLGQVNYHRRLLTHS